jgi:hypothetical protein
VKRATVFAVAVVLSATAAHAQIPLLAAGKTIDFIYDARDTRHDREAYEGRLFLPEKARRSPDEPLPFVVFLHGVNVDHTRFRFAGGKPDEPDIRLVVASLVASGTIPPVVLGAPGATVSCEVPFSTWPDFDLDRFVERSIRVLAGHARIDLDRVVLVGHSGAGCNPKGGLDAAVASTTLHLRGVFAVDTCLNDGPALAAADPTTDVIVTWQPLTWKRPFEEFSAGFRAGSPEGAVRVLDEMTPPHAAQAHNAMVELTLAKYLRGVLEKTAGR